MTQSQFFKKEKPQVLKSSVLEENRERRKKQNAVSSNHIVDISNVIMKSTAILYK